MRRVVVHMGHRRVGVRRVVVHMGHRRVRVRVGLVVAPLSR